MAQFQTEGVVRKIESHGYALVSRILPPIDRDNLVALLGAVPRAGRRGLLALPEITSLARSEALQTILRACLQAEPFAVRTIYFDKLPDSNWSVPWHQDLTIAVKSRIEVPGFRPWSMKDGMAHVQPPVDLLQRMLTVRLHLDDTDGDNGALQVLPGSHRTGRLSSGQIGERVSTLNPVVCRAAAGDALLMRPLILHASSKSACSRHRRVLHFEYASFQLPGGLEWHEMAKGRVMSARYSRPRITSLEQVG